MKKYLVAFVVLVGLVGCGSEQPSVPQKSISKKFVFSGIEFKFKSKHTPKIKYQSPSDVKKRLNANIMNALKEKNLLTNDKVSDKLNISVVYQRRFVGEDLVATDSLMPPLVGYDINITKNGETLRSVSRKDLVYNGGFFSNLKTIVGANRDNSYENDAIDSLSKNIIESLEELR